VDLDSGVDGELGVFGHLFALIPGKGLPQMIGEPLDHLGESGPRRLGGVTVGETEQHYTPKPPFHQGADGGHPLTQQQAPFPMPGDSTVIRFGGTLGDHHRVSDLAFTGGSPFLGEAGASPGECADTW
jgi:hypothetical protein